MIGIRHRNGRVIHGVGLQRAWVPWRDPSCLCAFDADPGFYVRNGSGVSRWNDITGHGYHALQPTALNQPTWTESDADFRGHGSISFTAAAAVLSTASFPVAIVQPFVVYAVFTKSPVATGVLLGGSASNIQITARSGGMTLSAPNLVYAPALAAGVDVGAFVFNGANSMAYTNGVAGTAGSAGTNGFQNLDIGNFYGTNYPFGSKIAFLAVFQASQHSARISKFLGSKYGRAIA